MKEVICKYLVAVIGCILTMLPSYAEDFFCNSIHFRILDEKNGNEVMILSPYMAGEEYDFPVNASGQPIIPESVEHNDVLYTVTTIGDNVFFNNEDIIEVTLPASITTIGNNNFNNCQNLQIISLPSVTVIGRNCIANCKKLSLLYLTKKEDIELGCDCLYNLGLANYTVPSNIKNITGKNFSGCHNLKHLDLSNTNIVSFFYISDVANLKSIILPKTFGHKLDSSFTGEYNLDYLVLPENIYSPASFNDCFWSNTTTINRIYCPSPTPLDVDTSADCSPEDCPEYYTFGGGAYLSDPVVYVPIGCSERYRNHPSWRMFTDFREIDFSTIDYSNLSEANVEIENEAEFIYRDGAIFRNGDAEDIEVYDLSGQLIVNRNLAPGIYIAKSGNFVSKVVINQ